MAKKKSGKRKSRAVWAKNTSEQVSRSKARADRIIKRTSKLDKSMQYKPTKMKGYDGKSHTYMVRTDSRGRRYILNQGQVAPEGYTQGGKGYYGLKRNLQITRNSSDAQKAFAAAHRPEIMGAHPDGLDKGAIDRMGMQGQNRTERGILESNFRKDAKTRKLMNEANAFFSGTYGHTGRSKSKFILQFGQDGREA